MANQIGFFPPITNESNKDEKFGHRDIQLCKRHRKWGFDMNEMDLDFVEYNNNSIPLAIIEYKTAFPKFPDEPLIDRKVKTLTYIADQCKIPALLTYYNPDFKYWKPFNLNKYAKLPLNWRYTEYQYVHLLYLYRNEDMPFEISQFLYGGRL